ncbi:hypothetical protein BC830DRAFT_1156930 [Chytriomyces sp. MP71]|nr:hypothetical protein BC830DRAFT_1156930 [Chytriomyces sp. MP71]
MNAPSRTDPAPEMPVFDRAFMARIELLGAQMVRLCYFGGCDTFGSPTELGPVYGLLAEKGSRLTFVFVKDSEKRSVADLVRDYSESGLGSQPVTRVDWWIGSSTDAAAKTRIAQQLSEMGFEKQTPSMWDLAADPNSLSRASQLEPLKAVFSEVTDEAGLHDRWTCIARARNWPDELVAGAIKGERSVAYGPSANIRYFVIRNSGDTSVVDATAGISFLEGSAYIFLVSIVPERKADALALSSALVWHAVQIAKLRSIKVVGLDTMDEAEKTVYESMGFVTVPNIDGYILKF